ncbi:MAG: response regulator [Acidobacteria bacterium]|nr:response regulator [Acidobacteriota bacterium]
MPTARGNGHTKPDAGLRREIETLRERISRLSAASVRISSSLDVETVLREIVGSARALTGARYGGIVTIDDAGEPQDFVSLGISPDEHRQVMEWTGGPGFFEHLRDLEVPLRRADLASYLRALGYTPLPVLSGSLQATPMRHRGRRLGTFCLIEKEGAGEFTSEDEELLVLFASQAATAVANARAHRDEQRARARLEALVDTSPVGVAVFDAPTGGLVSINREARRMAESLLTPGEPPEQLLEVMRCRLPDGREVALDELPLAQELTTAATMRGEEIEMSVPDGRSLTALMNVTPIETDGEVETVVVTFQDLAPLRELERQRTDFVSLVSHELRAPLTSIKGSTARLLDEPGELDRAEMREFHRIIDEQAEHMYGLIGDLLDAGRIETGTLSVSPEPSEVAHLVERARNTFLGGGARHTVLVDLPPALPPVMADRRRIVQVLNNLLANASRHAPESSPIRVAAVRDGVHVAVSVADEGSGVAPEQLPHLFRKYAGITAGHRERGLGRGLGLAICKGVVEAHGGRIWAESAGLGQGTRFTFTIPVTGDARTTDAPAGGDGNTPDNERDAERILVVDDDPQTLRHVRDALAYAGFASVVTGDPRDLSRIIREERPRLVLLDLMLPGTDGIELMERVPELADLPVIFLSVYGRDETVVRALEAGAADYIVKPFSPTELIARIRAELRRRAEPDVFVLGDLVIHYEERRVSVAGKELMLTATEFDLLRALSLDAGRVLTYEALLRRVWARRKGGDRKLVRVFVKQLRRKLGDDADNPAYIRTERGVGYRMPRPGGTP